MSAWAGHANPVTGDVGQPARSRGARARHLTATVGRRNRQREKLAAPETEYRDGEDNMLVLRGSLSPATRREYQNVTQAGLNQEDAWQRALEFLFERLAVSWTIAGLPTRRQKELLARYRVASASERQFIRVSIRRHLEQNFPELKAP